MISCTERGRTAFGELGFEVGNLVGKELMPLVGISCDGEFGPPPAWGTVGFSFHEAGCPSPTGLDDGRLCRGPHVACGMPGQFGCALQAYTLTVAAISGDAHPSGAPTPPQ